MTTGESQLLYVFFVFLATFLLLLDGGGVDASKRLLVAMSARWKWPCSACSTLEWKLGYVRLREAMCISVHSDSGMFVGERAEAAGGQIERLRMTCMTCH